MLAARRLRTSGFILLAAGLLAAVVIFCLVRPPEELDALSLDAQSKRDTRELELMGGKSYILFTDINEWVASLFHGRRLAYTVGVLSVAGILGCRWFAGVLEQIPPSDDVRRTNDQGD